MFVKRSMGRLGAAVGSVALLAGGLVNVSAAAAGPDYVINGVTYVNDADFAGYNLYMEVKNKSVDDFDLEACGQAGVQYATEKDQAELTGNKFFEISSNRVESGKPYSCNPILRIAEPPEAPTAPECEADGKVLNDEGTACRDKTAEETCEDSGKYWYDNACNEKSPSENECSLEGDVWEDGECREWEEIVDINSPGVGAIEGADGEFYTDVYSLNDSPDAPTSEHVLFTLSDDVTQAWGVPVPADVADGEPVQKNPPPPPCWDASINNCPVGGALRFVAPEYAMVGVPVTMYAYASWRPDANAPSQPTNGTAVIRVDGEDYSGVEFVDGVAEGRFIPETEGMKEFTASGVLFSGLSGANAYIDTVPARTYVLEYDPDAYETALKNKRVEVGDTYVITDPNQARSYLEDRYEWSVSEKSDDVCAVYETKKGAVKAKFNGEGKCTVIWMDKESEESGKYTFIAKK